MPMRFQVVTLTRLADDAFEVVAWDVFGEVLRRRVYRCGRLVNRWKWARRQAREWAARFCLFWEE